MNYLGINLWNWVPALSRDCVGLPTRAAEMGFTAVELPMTTTRPIPELEQEIRDLGLGVTLCAALGEGKDLSSFDPQVRASTMEYLTQCLETGARVGASVLAGPLYAGGGKRHALPPQEKEREWELAVTGLRELSRRAGEYGMRLAIEPLCRYRTSVVNTVDQGLAMIRDVDSPYLGLHYDTFHACLEEADLIASLEKALDSGKVYHFHACANNRGGPGEGILPWDRVLPLLKEKKYPGHLTMETFAAGGLDASWIQVHPQPDEVARRGIAFLHRYF